MPAPLPHPLSSSPRPFASLAPFAVKNHGRRWRPSAGFSLPELLVTISVIGILAGLAIQNYAGVTVAARESVAGDNLALLNRAVLHFSQVNEEIVVTPVSHAVSDELAVVVALKARDASRPGSPYLNANFPDAPAGAEEYRAQWNGRMFELLAPGGADGGLKME